MQSNYDKCLETILHHEGGYVNHPQDPGGETNLGVTKRVYEEWGGTKDMKDLLVEDVAPIYKKNLDKALKDIDKLISEVKQSSERGLLYIKTLVAAAPLFGLLGTVTGMVEVFDVMAITGSSNARAMAAGISKATLPTMSGMVASLSGLFFIAQLESRSKREISYVEDNLSLS